MSRFEVVTRIAAPPERVFEASLSVEAHTASMSAYEKPGYFVDEQIAGPFARWHHEHHLTGDGSGGTIMRDVVDFAAPFGPVGSLVDRLVLRRYLAALIEGRNRHLKQITERPA